MCQAIKDDGEAFMFETAFMSAKINKTVIVIIGEDVGLLTILRPRIPPNLEFLRPLKSGKGIMDQKIYSSTSLDGRNNEHILLLHAFSTCDGTSSIFQKVKSVAMKL